MGRTESMDGALDNQSHSSTSSEDNDNPANML
jgi:hypothetical protein